MPQDKASSLIEIPDAVLFACNMNSVRSPMASGILQHLAGTMSYVRSAGIRNELETDYFAIEVMNEIGIDITAHEPILIQDLYDSSFDLVITLTPEAHHQAMELTRYHDVEISYWPTIDPSFTEGSRDQRIDAYRVCRDDLFNRITSYFEIPGSM